MCKFTHYEFTDILNMSKKSKSKEAFLTDLDFCPRCGTVLPLPGLDDVVLCKLCSFKIDVNGL